MEKLEARIVELESTDRFPKFEFDKLKTRSNQTDIVPKENTLPGSLSETSTTDNVMEVHAHVQRNNSTTESSVGQFKRIPYIPNERRTPTGWVCLNK